MKNLKYYFEKAKKEKFAIGQFNFSTFEQVKGIVQAAKNLNSPVILGTSEGESKFVGLPEAVAMRNVLRKKYNVPVFLNLDHGKSFEAVKEAIDAGYDMVCFDGSKLPLEDLPAMPAHAGQAGNIKISKKVVSYAKWRGVLVEGEVGRFGTDASKIYQEEFKITEEFLTKPEEAKIYFAKTKVDVLAISIGNFHGMNVMGSVPRLDLVRFEEISNLLNIPFVLHGGSGTLDTDIRSAINFGVVKININTEIRLAFTNSLKKQLETNPDEITPYKYLQEPINEVQKIIEEKIKLFGSENKI
ncbi:MAG: class II fructose-bisphosphate aldolase [Patescibacteria group bacterium]